MENTGPDRTVCNFATQKKRRRRCTNPVDIILKGHGCCDEHHRHLSWSMRPQRNNPLTFEEWIERAKHKDFK